ncbi:hypothetical protein ACQJBY_068455 [Aegilops geniculata]
MALQVHRSRSISPLAAADVAGHRCNRAAPSSFSLPDHTTTFSTSWRSSPCLLLVAGVPEAAAPKSGRRLPACLLPRAAVVLGHSPVLLRSGMDAALLPATAGSLSLARDPQSWPGRRRQRPSPAPPLSRAGNGRGRRRPRPSGPRLSPDPTRQRPNRRATSVSGSAFQ